MVLVDLNSDSKKLHALPYVCIYFYLFTISSFLFLNLFSYR